MTPFKKLFKVRVYYFVIMLGSERIVVRIIFEFVETQTLFSSSKIVMNDSSTCNGVETRDHHS